MTLKDYQITHGETLRLFLETQAGRDLLPTLGALSPQYEAFKEEHLFIDNRGSIKGYAIAIRNIMSLTFVPKISSEPEINYGVPENK